MYHVPSFLLSPLHVLSQQLIIEEEISMGKLSFRSCGSHIFQEAESCSSDFGFQVALLPEMVLGQLRAAEKTVTCRNG